MRDRGVALAGLDLCVAAGNVHAVLGPNGAGKTTAVRILTTLLPPDGGLARVLGLDVVADARRLRSRLGLAGQHAAVDEGLTGAENLEMFGRLHHLPRRVARARAAELPRSASPIPREPRHAGFRATRDAGSPGNPGPTRSRTSEIRFADPAGTPSRIPQEPRDRGAIWGARTREAMDGVLMDRVLIREVREDLVSA